MTEQPTLKHTHFSLVKIQGLITTGKNKSGFLSGQLKDINDSNVIASTETWLTDGHHNQEVLRYVPNYTIHRSDKKTVTARGMDDPNALQSRGGVSFCQVRTLCKFSNGNVELTISHFPSEKLIVAVIYNPTPPNFSLHEFSKMIQHLRTTLKSMDLTRNILL